jgi:hypothetical protein
MGTHLMGSDVHKLKVALKELRETEIWQEYPVSVRRETHRPGATVRWHVPPETAMIVRVLPENNAQGAHP